MFDITMVDLSDLGDGSGKGGSPFGKSAKEQMLEATRSPFEQLASEMNSPLDKAMRKALESSSVISALVKRDHLRDALGASGIDGLTGSSALANQMQAYEKSQERLRDAFSTSGIDKVLARASETDPMSQALELATKGLIPPAPFDSYPALTIPELPPNPIFETNAHLEEVGEKIDALLDVQAKQAGLIDLLLKSQIEGGKIQTRIATGGLIVGLIGVVVAVLATVLS